MAVVFWECIISCWHARIKSKYDYPRECNRVNLWSSKNHLPISTGSPPNWILTGSPPRRRRRHPPIHHGWGAFLDYPQPASIARSYVRTYTNHKTTYRAGQAGTRVTHTPLSSYISDLAHPAPSPARGAGWLLHESRTWLDGGREGGNNS